MIARVGRRPENIECIQISRSRAEVTPPPSFRKELNENLNPIDSVVRPELEERLQAIAAERSNRFQQLANSLPGSIPYDNLRPVNVPGRFDGATIFEVMCGSHPHISKQQWAEIFDAGLIRKDDQSVNRNRKVRGGEQFIHVFPNAVEPDVSCDVRVLWEDESIVAISKPAPLPMHPSGRFNLNTLTHFVSMVYEQERLRPAHRLDANTTGVVLLSRNESAATFLQNQFEFDADPGVSKVYLAMCHGTPNDDQFECRAPIGKTRGRSGLRVVAKDGKPSWTQFKVLRRYPNDRCLLVAIPKTGRTNQIRVHLWSLGMSIIGDPLYLPDKELGRSQTLAVDKPPMCLHAAKLTFVHPQRGEMTMVAPNPNWVDHMVPSANL